MLDISSSVLGVSAGRDTVELTGLTCTDDGEGNITITNTANEEEEET